MLNLCYTIYIKEGRSWNRPAESWPSQAGSWKLGDSGQLEPRPQLEAGSWNDTRNSPNRSSTKRKTPILKKPYELI